MKTIKQIADGLGVDKQKVSRIIKKHRISESVRESVRNRITFLYDEATESRIVELISDNAMSQRTDSESVREPIQTAPSNTVVDTVIDMLKLELKVKNRQIVEQQQSIRELTAALEHTTASLHAAQALHAGTMQKRLTDGGAEHPSSGFIARLFRRNGFAKK